MDRSKMPAQMDSKLPNQAPATMPSDTQNTGDGGSNDAPQVEISLDAKRDSAITWQNTNEVNEGWQTADKKTGKAWELSDRKETNMGGLPQRDPDNDGDLN